MNKKLKFKIKKEHLSNINKKFVEIVLYEAKQFLCE